MLQKLYEKRKEFAKVQKENDYNASEIIAHLYSENTHFIYELLQNAEDSEASFIEFDLEDEFLAITHNGKQFNYDDVNAITTIGASTKKDDLNKIGKFGAGFKSVFSVTNTPQIYSGDLSFEIYDYIIPQKISKIDLEKSLTKIVLPFNSEEMDKSQTYKTISEKLQGLESESLLFLKNIKSISWNFEERNGSYTKDIKSSTHCSYIDISVIVDDTRIINNYIKIDKLVEIKNKSLTLSIAYGLKDNQVVPIENSKLSVFFPTKVDIHYKFLLQAPYKTTPNRESIAFEDDDNKIITAELSSLVGKSFLILKEEDLLNIEFLESMAFDLRSLHNKLYMSIYEEIKKSFQLNELLPTSCKKFAKSIDITLVQNNDLLEFIKDDDILKFTNKPYLFCKHYSNSFTRFLNAILGVRVFNNDNIFEKIDIDFLKSKDDNWLISLYTLLIKQNFHKVHLSTKPIIKLNDDSFVSLYNSTNEEKPQVYLATQRKTKFKVIHSLFLGENLKEFIEKYKIIKPNNISELKEFILPKYTSTPQVTKEEYLEDFSRIVQIYNSVNNTERDQIITLCKERFLILNGEIKLYRAQDIYLDTDELKNWFKKSKKVKFVDSAINTDETQSFLNRIGIHLAPKLINLYPYIDGLKNILENITFDDSLMIWNYYVKHLTFYHIQKTDCDIRYVSNIITYLKSVLNNTQWLKTKFDDEFVKPSEVIFQDLDSRYKYSDEIKKYITIDLTFKPDKIKQLEEELNCVMIKKDEFNEFKKWKEEKAKKDQNIIDDIKSDIWSSTTKPNSIQNIQVKSYKSFKDKPNLSYQTKSTHTKHSFKTAHKNYDNFESRKAIGDWGEEFVYNYLKNQYNDKNIEVKWLNQDSYLGIGYDFVIIEDGQEIEYIEVKSKLSHNPSTIEVSGTQWEWARDLYNSKNGDAYKIYVVLAAGNDNAILSIITNPIKQWKEGTLKVHPVNIEL